MTADRTAAAGNEKGDQVTERGYQYDFSAQHADAMYDETGRAAKAAKVLAIIADHCGDLGGLRLLDIGCSTGIMTRSYAKVFGYVTAIDIDEPAVRFAQRANDLPNVEFRVADSMATGLPADSFDVVTCTHIYEHVPDAQRLVDEIYRVLKPGGVCMFAAGNRFALIEPHYRLPLLAAVPKWLGHRYIRLAGKAPEYYETHRSVRGLRALVRRFEVLDYTERVLREPERFGASDLLRSGTPKQRLALAVVRYAYWLVPTYLWLLRKPTTERP